VDKRLRIGGTHTQIFRIIASVVAQTGVDLEDTDAGTVCRSI
jgi:hypothetical protein